MPKRKVGSPPNSSATSGHRRTRRGAVFAATVALVVTFPLAGAHASTTAGSPGLSQTSPPASVSAGGLLAASRSLTPAEYEGRLKHWMNVARENHGARGIAVNSCVDNFAESWSLFLARTNSFYHQDLGAMMRTCSLSSAGEILALGAVRPRQMIQMFMNSPAHRQILLSRGYAFSGISATKKSDGSWVGTIEFGHR